MSAVPVFYQSLLMRVARVFIVALFFLCAGPFVQFAVFAILTNCYTVASPLISGEASYWSVIHFDVYGGRLLLPALVSLAPLAGLTGLIAGICDTMFIRVNARIMLVISLIMALAALFLFVWRSAPVLIQFLDHDANAAWFFLGPVLVQRFCFVVSMMACWKLVDMMRSGTPAAGGLAPT